jgi:predicted pyridoxine 5'-phosphate oxidase superfamily flavin-nucleotide-binding protein
MDDRTVTSNSVSDEAALRGLYQPPMELAVLKQLDRLDSHCRNFLAHSPFAVIGSTRPGRGTDVSPRGDAPGFARALDDHTIAIPDRPGNNRLDTMSNIVADAEVGLLFFIPGIDETLRINGAARLSHEPALLAAAAVNGREPRLVNPGHGAGGVPALRQGAQAFQTLARGLPGRETLVSVAGADDRRTDQAGQRNR